MNVSDKVKRSDDNEAVLNWLKRGVRWLKTPPDSFSNPYMDNDMKRDMETNIQTDMENR